MDLEQLRQAVFEEDRFQPSGSLHDMARRADFDDPTMVREWPTNEEQIRAFNAEYEETDEDE